MIEVRWTSRQLALAAYWRLQDYGWSFAGIFGGKSGVKTTPASAPAPGVVSPPLLDGSPSDISIGAIWPGATGSAVPPSPLPKLALKTSLRMAGRDLGSRFCHLVCDARGVRKSVRAWRGDRSIVLAEGLDPEVDQSRLMVVGIGLDDTGLKQFEIQRQFFRGRPTQQISRCKKTNEIEGAR